MRQESSRNIPKVNIDPLKLDKEINQLKFPDDPQIYTYNFKDLEYVDIIESGRHIVKEWIYEPKNLKIAVKTIRIPQNRFNEDQEKIEKLELLKKEVVNFRQLSGHPNIVSFYGLCFSDGEAMICMELMDMSLYDLYLMVHDKKEKFPEKILGYITVRILSALGFCKSKNFIHRDVKPKNILMNRKGEVKLCDFGESRILKDSLASTFVGTIAYWPPERFLNNKDQKPINESNFRYDVRSDIWSLGITIVEAIYGSIPFKDDKGVLRKNEIPNTHSNIMAVQHSIMKANADEIIDRCLGDSYSNEMKHFIRLCLQPVANRPKYDKLMETEFYQLHASQLDMTDMMAFMKKIDE